VFRSMSLLDRYLAVWILLAMIIGVLLGYYVPAIRDAWETVSVANVSLPIAIGLWWMMYPVLCKVRFELLPKLSRSWGLLFHIGISLAINWVLAPLLMTGLAWATLPDQAGLRTGIILVGIARCIAMVLIWNHLAGGNAEFCAILVAVNSILQVPSRAPFAFSPPAIPYTICSSSPLLFPPQVILYSPLAIFYIGVVSHGGVLFLPYSAPQVILYSPLAIFYIDVVSHGGVLFLPYSPPQVILYSPLAIFYIDVVSHGGSVDVSFWTVAKSVLIFLGVPLLAAVITRFTLRGLVGAKWYDEKFLPWFGPTALIGLLFTIFVMFSLQGQNIGNNIGKVWSCFHCHWRFSCAMKLVLTTPCTFRHAVNVSIVVYPRIPCPPLLPLPTPSLSQVARVAVPLLIYFGIVFFSVMALCWRLGFAYCDAVTQSFTAGSNNFELAIAVAVASYGIGSDEALAAVVGPLIEVPVLIGLVYVTLWIRQKLQWKNNGAVLDADDFLEKE
ncbi:unnamed protein product, partial [Closterium sp. NIES-54]